MTPSSFSRVVPDGVLRAVDRLRKGRFISSIAPATQRYTEAHGTAVRHGPLAGLSYSAGLECASGDLVAKLLGAYECELHGAIEELIASGSPLIVDVGCAEGYYAVGLAVKMPASRVYAYDIDEDARRQCRELALLNGVSGRVEIRSACTPTELRALPDSGVALVCDCEGYEKSLLDPACAPVLVGWWMLVELHEFLDPSITDTLVERFADSHEIELIAGRTRSSRDFPELADESPQTQAALLSEYRPCQMRWAILRPRLATTPG